MESQSNLQDVKAEARTLLGAGQAAEAVTKLRNSLAMSDGDAECHALLGAALGMTGDTAGSVRQLEIAVNMDGSQAPTWNNLGQARERAGDGAGAREAYSNALRINPNYARAAESLRRLTGSSTVAPTGPSAIERGQRSAFGAGAGIPPSFNPSQPASSPAGLPNFSGSPIGPSGPAIGQAPPPPYRSGAPAYGEPTIGMAPPPIPGFQPSQGMGPGAYGGGYPGQPGGVGYQTLQKGPGPFSSGPPDISQAPQIVRSIRWLFVLGIAGSVLMMLGGLAMAALPRSGMAGMSGMLGTMYLIMGVPLLALYLWLYKAMATATKAAYYVILVVGILVIIGGILSVLEQRWSGVVGLVIWSYILIYWVQQETKEWFGA